jgi:DNA polymerase I-like protein with 3'-5' exonuclease and polymerase domains
MWGDALFREAYAWNPQSTVADLLNFSLIRFVALVESHRERYEPMLQNHDAFLVQCPIDRVDDCIATMREAFDVELEVGGRRFKIPVELKKGMSWGEMEKIK